MLRRAFIFPAVAAIIVAVVVITGPERPAKSLRAAPALPSEVLVAPTQDIRALAGHPAAINFWASWCGPCRKEAPQLERLSHQLPGQARLVGVDWSDELGGGRAFVKRYGWTFPNLRDPNGVVGNAYGIRGLPTTFILNARGQVVSALQGPQTVASISQALRQAN